MTTSGKSKKPLIVVLALVAVVVLMAVSVWGWYVKTYNGLVVLDESANTAWAQIETELQRRYDLVPNLVNTVKGYAAHEDKVLTAVTEARSHVGSARTINDKMAANGELSSALSRLLVVSENYPNLKANQNFLDLQVQLEGTENRITVSRKRYNDAVLQYNAALRGLFEQFVAKHMGLERKKLFESAQGAEKAPEVKF
jgi:LemA protein